MITITIDTDGDAFYDFAGYRGMAYTNELSRILYQLSIRGINVDDEGFQLIDINGNICGKVELGRIYPELDELGKSIQIEVKK